MITLKNNWWVPNTDTQCLKSVLRDVTTIDNFFPYVKNRKICIQAGGNLGVWPKKLSELFETVYTFEPENENWEALQKNLKGVRNVISKKYALGSSLGTVSVDIVYPNNSGAHQIKEGGDVEKITIDSLNLKDVGLIQLDIEGSEHDAILGAIETLKTNSPVVVLELKGLGKRYGHSDEDTIKILNDLGYRHVKTVKRDWIFVKPHLYSIETKKKKIKSCIPKNEIDVISPLSDYYGTEIKSVLEFGCKKNQNGVYKSDFESLDIKHVSIDEIGKHGSMLYSLETPLWETLGLFDMVTNIGISEHYENQSIFWENMHRCLRVGGAFISITPHSGDHLTHGIWYPMVEFYEEFAYKNGYDIEKLYIIGKAPKRLVQVRMYKKEDKNFTMPDASFMIRQP